MTLPRRRITHLGAVLLIASSNYVVSADKPAVSVVPKRRALRAPPSSNLAVRHRGGGSDSNVVTASPMTSVFNLVNNVAGAGLLTLSAGMAGGVGSGPAAIVGVVLGGVSAYTFSAVGTCCEALGVTDFRGLWCKTIGEESAFIIDAAISVMCLSACVIYSGIIADVITSLLATAGVSSALNGRSTNLLGITGGVLLPLCLLKSLSALGFTSMLGLASILYTAVFIVYRALDGSYAPGGHLLAALIAEGPEAQAMIPKFDLASTWGLSPKAFVLASNLGLAYIAHYNAPRYYSELEGKNPKKFKTVVYVGFVVLAALYVGVMLSGHAIFGDNCQSSIINNFARTDALAVGGRIATLLSIVFGYPLAFCGLIDGVRGTALSLSKPEDDKKGFLTTLANPSPWEDDLTRITLLALATTIAVLVEDIGLVVGLTGSVVGAAIVYVAPSVISLRARIAAAKAGNEAEVDKMLGGAFDRTLSRALIPLGMLVGVVGVYQTILTYLNPMHGTTELSMD